MDTNNKTKIYYILLAALTLLFAATRLFRLDSVPFTSWGMELDELGAAYDAYCIQGWGVDRYLTKFPLVFLNTGDGQNALYIYLAALIFKFFGYSLFKFRMVAVLCAAAAYACLYFLSRRIYGDSLYALVPNALMTIMPVFMMSEHWGLESYLFLSFSIISFCFLDKAVDSGKARYYALDGALWGLTLYTYGISYIVVPVFLAIMLIYLIFLKKVNLKLVMAAVVPLLILGVPLFAEQLVIARVIEPFSLGFMDFLPTERIRWGEISIRHIPKNFTRIFRILFVQDGMLYIDSPISICGTIYYLSIPFMVIGIIAAIRDTVISIKDKAKNTNAMILCFLIVSWVVALMTDSLRIVTSNEVYFPLMMFTAYGIMLFLQKINKKYVAVVLSLLYAIYFVVFAAWMYTGREFGWSSLTQPRDDDYIYVDLRAAEAALEAKEIAAGRPIEMIINYKGEDWYTSVCLYMGTSPYDFQSGELKGDGYKIEVPEEFDFSGGTVYLIEDELHHITDYLVSEGFTNQGAEHGQYSIVYR